MTVLFTVFMPVCLQARAAAPQLLLVAPYASHWRKITLQRLTQRQASHLTASLAAHSTSLGHFHDFDAEAMLRARVCIHLLLHHIVLDFSAMAAVSNTAATAVTSPSIKDKPATWLPPLLPPAALLVTTVIMMPTLS